MHDETFVQMAAVAQSFPFTLDLAALHGATVAGAGSYQAYNADTNTRNKVETLTGSVRIQLVLRQAVDIKTQDLTECYTCVLAFMKEMPPVILKEAQKQGQDGGLVTANHLKEAAVKFASARPILQINFHSAAGDKYAFVTNVKLSKDGQHLLLRNITRSNPLITPKDVCANKDNINKAAGTDQR